MATSFFLFKNYDYFLIKQLLISLSEYPICASTNSPRFVSAISNYQQYGAIDSLSSFKMLLVLKPNSIKPLWPFSNAFSS